MKTIEKKGNRSQGAAAKRTKAQREFDLQIIAKYYLEGIPQKEIPELLSKENGRRPYTPMTISYDIKYIRQRWKDSYIEDVNEYINMSLDKIDNLEATYWQAWYDSGGKHIIKTTKQEPVLKEKKNNENKNEDQSEVEIFYENTEINTREEEIVGDEKFLAGVRWCIDRRIQLLGLDAPKKIAPTDPTGREEYGKDIEAKNEVKKNILLTLIAGNEKKEAKDN